MRWVVCCLVVLTWLVEAQTALAGDEKQPKHADKKAQTQATQPRPTPTLVSKPPSKPAPAATATSKAAAKPTSAPPAERAVEGPTATPAHRAVDLPAAATPVPRPRAQADVATPAPTLEPTREPEIVDVAADANARSSRTALPSPPATPTASPVPVSAASPMHDVVAESFEPMLIGGRIGLIGGAVTGLTALAVHVVRRRR